MTKYDQGRRFEWKTRDDLTPNGYEVIRAAGSKGSTKIDLVALKPGQLLFIQCKEDGKLGPAEWDRVVEVAGWVGAIPLLAANGPRGRGVTYTRLLGPKVPRARTQPCEPFLLDEIAGCTHEWHGADGGPCPGCGWNSHPIPDMPVLPSGTDEIVAWMRRHGLGHGAGVGAVLAAVRADLARPLVPVGPWEPALRIAPECSTSQPQMHADCDGCGCRCHPEPARPVVAPYLPTAAAPEGINDVHLPAEVA